jgi:hypothetical protein
LTKTETKEPKSNDTTDTQIQATANSKLPQKTAINSPFPSHHHYSDRKTTITATILTRKKRSQSNKTCTSQTILSTSISASHQLTAGNTEAEYHRSRSASPGRWTKYQTVWRLGFQFCEFITSLPKSWEIPHWGGFKCSNQIEGFHHTHTLTKLSKNSKSQPED